MKELNNDDYLNMQSLVVDLLLNHVLWLTNKSESANQSIHLCEKSLMGLRAVSKNIFPQELAKLNSEEPELDVQGFSFKIKL